MKRRAVLIALAIVPLVGVFLAARQAASWRPHTITSAEFDARVMPIPEVTFYRTSVTVVRDNDPVAPLLRVTLVRHFELGPENYPAYVILMERVGDKIQLLGTGTTDDPGAL